MKENWKEANDSEILYSQIIKAGKRVYYIDVKCDRRKEYYISMTESKRVKEGTETERPVFEKHKIFLYREDILKFMDAFEGCAQFINERRPISEPVRHYADDEQNPQIEAEDPATEGVKNDGTLADPLNADFNIEF